MGYFRGASCEHMINLFGIMIQGSDQIRSDQSLSRVRLFATSWIAARQASLSITNSRSSLRLTSIESAMPSSHLVLCRPLLLLPPIPPCIRERGRLSSCLWNLGFFSDRCTEKLPLRVDFIHRVEFGEVSGHRVLIKRGPGNRGPTECGTTHEATSGMSS